MSYLLEEAARVLADLREAGYDVVEVEVGQCGVVAALPLHLEQQQVPAVERGQDALLLPGNTRAHTHTHRQRETGRKGSDTQIYLVCLVSVLED